MAYDKPLRIVKKSSLKVKGERQSNSQQPPPKAVA